jgi:hypothetical protein
MRTCCQIVLMSLFAVMASARTPLMAQTPLLPPALRTAADGISGEQLAWDLARLASDEWQGRNTPSPGFDAAADYITARLARAGLKPAGDDGGFRQHYELHETRVDTNNAFIEVNGQRFALGRDFALRSFAAPLAASLSVVYVGHGWVVPGKGIDPYAGLDVKGKLVLAHGPRAIPKGVDIQLVGRVAVNAQTPFVAAAERGAAGILFITQASQLVRWDELKDANAVLREMAPAVPSAYLAIPVTSVLLAPHVSAALLDGEALDPQAALRLGDEGVYPASFALRKPVRVQIASGARTVLRPYNVVAMLEGSDSTRSAEVVTIAAHLDGAVGSREVAGDRLYNSADDNASGSAALLSMAEQMAKAPRPKRSVIFVWDSGEEQGLWGTRWFVHKPPVALASIVAHINVDMIGASRSPGGADAQSADVTERGEVFVVGPRVLSASVDALLARVNGEYLKLRFNHKDDRADSESFYPRTDAGPFLERGILTIGFDTGMHARYHLPSDEARHLDPVQMRDIARTIMASVWALANADERPRIDRPLPPSVPRYR